MFPGWFVYFKHSLKEKLSSQMQQLWYICTKIYPGTWQLLLNRFDVDHKLEFKWPQKLQTMLGDTTFSTINEKYECVSLLSKGIISNVSVSIGPLSQPNLSHHHFIILWIYNVSMNGKQLRATSSLIWHLVASSSLVTKQCMSLLLYWVYLYNLDWYPLCTWPRLAQAQNA